MKVTVAIVVVSALLLLSGCGGGSSSSSANGVSVTISPASASLNQGQTVQFTAAVSGSSNTGVTWQVNGTTGGSASTGTVSTTGLYTAPSTINAATVVTVTAVAQADTTKTALATVTLNPPPAPYTPGIIVNPTSITLNGGAQVTFTAAANGAPISGVIWTVTCNSTNAADCGTINSSTGAYVAPFTPPSGGGITVTATAAGTNPGSASVTVQYANSSLTGQYAFVLTGQNPSGTFGAMVGSVQFDGQGNVTGGKLDATGVGQTAITGGSYHVVSNGTGGITVNTAAGASNWQFALQNHSHADAVVIPGGGSFATVTAAGTLALQDATQFNAAALTGNFAFRMAGASSGHAPNSLQRVGVVAVDGAGNITTGRMDQNDAGTATQDAAITTSTYTAPDTNGRGTLTLNGDAVAYYVVDANRWQLFDTTVPAAGEAAKQSGGPFAAANFTGNYVFTMRGVSAAGPTSAGGVLAFTGATGTLGASSLIDVNDNGNLVSPSQSLSGAAYTVADATTGRTTMTWAEATGPKNIVAYPGASGTLYVLSLDAFSESGTAYAQSNVVTSSAALTGTFVARGSGAQFSPAGEVAFAGTVVPSGGNSFSGTLDINSNGTYPGSSSLLNGQLTVSTGIVTVNVNSSSPAFPSASYTWYAANRSRLLIMETDSSRVLTGVLEKQ